MADVFLPASRKSADEEGARASNSCGQRKAEERFTHAAAESRDDARRVAGTSPAAIPWSCLGMRVEEPRTRRGLFEDTA